MKLPRKRAASVDKSVRGLCLPGECRYPICGEGNAVEAGLNCKAVDLQTEGTERSGAAEYDGRPGERRSRCLEEFSDLTYIG
jgi:hypothetical protein